MRCPLRKYTEPVAGCRADCAWYNAKDEECLFKTLVQEIKKINDRKADEKE